MKQLELLFLRYGIVLAGSLAGAVSDWKTGLIFDKITCPMIALGLALNAWDWFLGGFELMLGARLFGIGTVLFSLGYVFYITGKVGGGDVKMLSGIAFLVPFAGESVFVLNALFLAAVTATVFFGAFYSVKYAKKGIKAAENREGIKKAGLFALVFAVYFYVLYSIGYPSLESFLVLAVPVCFALVFLALEKGIRKNFFLKWVSAGELEEDEIVAMEFADKRLKKELRLGFKGVIGEKEKEKLGKAGFRKIPVYRDLPRFGPFIFLGVLLAIAFPDFLGLLFL